MTIRPYRFATENDIPALVALAREQYLMYKLELAERWAAACINRPDAAFVINGDAAAIVAHQIEFWNFPNRIADVLPMFGKPDHANPLGVYGALVGAVEWAKDNGCYGIRFGCSEGATNGAHSDRRGLDLFEPFAKRLGARLWGKTYIKEFG